MSATREALIQTLEDTVTEGDVLSIEFWAAHADALLNRFDIREKSPAHHTPPAPVVGQTWRNKRSDRLVVITAVPAPGTDPFSSTAHIGWAALTGRGPTTGSIWGRDWASKFEFIADAGNAGEFNDVVIHGPNAATVTIGDDGHVYGSWPVLLRRGTEVIAGTRMGRYGGIMADVDGRRFVEHHDAWWEQQGFEITEPNMPMTGTAA